ncbi:MAG: hypothetical protein H5T64_12620 [Chloroflexi bacterium]|nr:hypothetical protein [Chloroflexota bacterium]
MDSSVVGTVVRLPTPERPTPEIKPLDLPGLDEVWNSRNARWEYADVDGQSVAYWDAEKQRIEITATTLTEKHLGLFAPVSPQEAQKVFNENFIDENNFKFAFPFDVKSLAGGFEVTLGETIKGRSMFLLKLPNGAISFAPAKARVINLENPYETILTLHAEDVEPNILYGLTMGKGAFLAGHDTRVPAGTPVMKMVDSSVEMTSRYPGYNCGMASSHDTDFNFLARSKDGRILYITGK